MCSPSSLRGIKKENMKQKTSKQMAEELRDTMVLNGTEDPKDKTSDTESFQRKGWRRLTITFTVLAATLTMTFSWQKKDKSKVDSTSTKTEAVITTPDAQDSLPKATNLGTK
jgi:hypothetical protein